MKEFFNKLNKYLTIKNVGFASIVLNLTSIVFGIIYLLNPVYNVIYDIFGIILLITLFENLLLVYVNTLRLNKSTKLGNRINLLCYIYLIFIIYAMFLIAIGNTINSMNYSNELEHNTVGYSMMLTGYFGVLAFGAIIAFLDIKNLENREIWDLETRGSLKQSKRTLTIKKIIKIFIGLICLWSLLWGLFFAYGMLFGSIEVVAEVLASFSALFGPFWAIQFLAVTLILLKMFNRQKSPKRYYAIALIGLFVASVMIMPLFLTPYSVYRAEADFTEAFGDDWRDKIPDDIEKEYFLKTPFSMAGYFLGIPPKDCEIDKDVRFYNREGIELRFDAYYLEDGKDLPGENSVLIRIHGGGWRYGDKGGPNMMQMNKYFAAQGYVVFDIQYAMMESEGDAGILGAPEEVVGDFIINDEVRTIGAFTKYLYRHRKDYDVNLDSVFVSGGSAGGHLTIASALCMAHNYTDYFSQNLTVKGMIPFYPGPPDKFLSGVAGNKKLINPEEYLVKKSSPPCLIFQGSSDYLCAEEAKNVKKNYDKKDNDDCCIIWLPLGGHACDIYYTGYYNQVFLYYMERFMYLCVNDEIE